MALLPTPQSDQPPTGERIRLTISVTPEVHATFQRMADASGMSLGKAMGDWLGDTAQAAEEMVKLLEKAKAAPKLLIQEMHSFVLGLADETGGILDEIRAKSRVQRPEGGPAPRGVPPAAGPESPRLVIRGVKSTRKGPGTRGAKS